MKAINMAGGIITAVTFDGMARAPLYKPPICTLLAHFVKELSKMKNCFLIRKRDKRSFCKKLQYIEPTQMGTKVFLRLVCKTGDAMGMNGVTKAAADISRKLLQLLPDWKLLTISSNMCSDKKSAHINILHGRGKVPMRRYLFLVKFCKSL